ncbi:1-acyl-sn-glycerol-3-phosphate acyltransferase [Virgibacillus phasianinus]|uniref:1-acyl-sn-glycerol-3-phosphate acyltransferase n=1 Tax=Virgibacillus phasianinus TaxID=2017483 RepID=A0A220TZ93_9BACI|nr:lysophospholipid acyltransferase family protein [Virgibacillus phasianinus]ASK61100.1 1-acyl-sn-glycerol-3-phosphate acyltransferase [Virgibacillus phasianinus]
MIRSVWIYFWAILIVLQCGLKIHKGKKLFKKNTKEAEKALFEAPKLVSTRVIKLTGTDVHVSGREKLPDESVLFVANHQGLFDILALIGYTGKPLGFIAKKEIEKVPIISTWMELMHGVFIDRSDRRQSVRAINQGIKNLKNGHSLVVFPEGTRSRKSNLNTFKSGSLRLATKANVPIVPIAINGTYQMLEEGNGRVKGSTITMEILDPIYPEVYQEKKHSELAEQLQSAIEKSLQKML